MPAVRRDGVDNGEADESDNHHLEQFQEVIADEAPCIDFRFQARAGLGVAVFSFQTKGTEEEEDGHTIVSEERNDVHRQQGVRMGADLHQPVDVVLGVLIFVLLHHRIKPVAVVMQEDAEDSESPHHVAFRTG